MNIVALFKVPQPGIAYLDIVAYLNITNFINMLLYVSQVKHLSIYLSINKCSVIQETKS